MKEELVLEWASFLRHPRGFHESMTGVSIYSKMQVVIVSSVFQAAEHAHLYVYLRGAHVVPSHEVCLGSPVFIVLRL